MEEKFEVREVSEKPQFDQEPEVPAIPEWVIILENLIKKNKIKEKN